MALEAKGPTIAEPADNDLLIRRVLKLGGLTILDLRNLILAIIVTVLAGVALDQTRTQFPTAFWGVMFVVSLCLANVAWHSITLVREKRHDAILRRLAIRSIPPPKAKYFEVGAYTRSAADVARYHRPDGAGHDILSWVRTASDPVLYLSGPSGAGKSSLLNAALIPKLQAGDEPAKTLPFLVIAIPEHGDLTTPLREELLRPEAVWRQPTKERDDEPMESLLAAACQHLTRTGRRLLLLCDQFEVVMVRHQAENAETTRFAALLKAIASGRPNGFPGLVVLLSFRSDYDELLQTIAPTPWVDNHSGQRIGSFSRPVARAFLTDPRSGLQLADERLNSVLDEAEAVTGANGLFRPIVLNMLGKLLERHADRLPELVPCGGLLAHDIRMAVEAIEVRNYARPILRTLLHDGLRVTRTVSEIAALTGTSPVLVSGCLQKLQEWPLVRCATEDKAPLQSQWEIAHDFVARILVPILETPRPTLVERLRHVVTPILLLIVLACGGILWLEADNLRVSALNKYGLHVVFSSDAMDVIVARPQKITPETFPKIVKILQAFKQPLTLNLERAQLLTSIDGIDQLTQLTALKLDSRTLNSLNSLKGLPRLTSLSLFPAMQRPADKAALKAAAPDYRVLEDLTTLQSVRLPKMDAADLKHLSKLVHLKSLLCASPNDTSLDFLKPLTELQAIDFSDCSSIYDIKALHSLGKLTTLHLGRLSIQKLDLGSHGMLKELEVANSTVLKELNVSGSANLSRLTITNCKQLSSIVGLHAHKMDFVSIRGTHMFDGALLYRISQSAAKLDLDSREKTALREENARRVKAGVK